MALTTELKNFVKDAADGSLEGLHISDRSGLELLGKLAAKMEANAAWIQWSGGTDNDLNGLSANAVANVGAAAAQLETSLELALTDTDNNIYEDAAYDYTVDLTAADGAGTSNWEYSLDDGATWTAFSGATQFTLTDGKLAFKVRADYAGAGNNWTLTMSNASGGKSTDGVLTLTAS